MVNSTGESNDLKFSMLILTSTKHTSIRTHYSINKKKFSILFRYLTKKSLNKQIVFDFCPFRVKSKGKLYMGDAGCPIRPTPKEETVCRKTD